MWGRASKQKLSRSRQDNLTRDAPSNKGRVDAGVALVCCGEAVEPRLAEIQDRFLQTLFTAMWHCPYCGRVTY